MTGPRFAEMGGIGAARPSRRRRVLALALGALAWLVSVTPAGASPYAPVNQPGPPLDVPVAKLQSAIVCSSLVGQSGNEPVLLVPGTGATFQIQWQWNFAVALSDLGIPWCGVSPPEDQTGDIQIAAEYDVYAIRYLYHRSGGRRIAIVGHSQGGMQPRWALRFWPDTRAMVADDVGIAPDNQGGSGGNALCPPNTYCELTLHQQDTGSSFITALNSRQQMFPGIDYTVIYSTMDEIVFPQDTPLYGPGSYARIALQDVCPGHLADHFLDGTIDPVSWGLTLDAITQPGPASRVRIPSTVCSELVMPGLAATWPLQFAQAAASFLAARASAQDSYNEPPLKCYVYAACTGAAAPTLTMFVSTSPRRIRARHRARIHILVRTDEGGVLVPVPGATITLGRKRRTTGAGGDVTITTTPKRPGHYRVTANRAGTNPARTTITAHR